MSAKRVPLLVTECQEGDCGQLHEATFSHDGRFGEGEVFVVYCGGFADYYTEEVVRQVRRGEVVDGMRRTRVTRDAL